MSKRIFCRDRCITSLWQLTCRQGRDTSVPTTDVSTFNCQIAYYYVLLICFLLVSLSACSTNPSSTKTQLQPTISPTQRPSPTPTKPPAGTVLYQADLSHGLAGWQNAHGWRVVQGQLETDTGGAATFTLPYIPTVANYALEIRIQIVRLLKENGGYFSLSAPQLPEKNGYDTGISGMEGTQPRPNGAHPSAQVSLKPADASIQGTGMPIDYEPHFGEHTYRVEVQDNEVSLFSDDVSLVSVSSGQTDTLSNGPITFKCDQLILRIRSLRVLTA